MKTTQNYCSRERYILQYIVSGIDKNINPFVAYDSIDNLKGAYKCLTFSGGGYKYWTDSPIKPIWFQIPDPYYKFYYKSQRINQMVTITNMFHYS